MENYEVGNVISVDGKGIVHLATNKKDGKTYVLKMIECQDESAANTAFQEALALQKLNHPYICGYKEFFVLWDKSKCAMFLCIVMDFYQKGNLKKIINEYQEKKELISEEQIQKYLGEIMEALIFVHLKGILHRDLNPSNIFVKDDGTLCLGDFAVATIIGDIVTNTRCPAGTTNYMAPEALEGEYYESSDLWSLGCVLFEMATTNLFQENEIGELLKSIPNDIVILEEVLEDIAENYSCEMVKTLRSMLKPDVEVRMSPIEVAKNSPYIRKCLEVSDSTVLEKRKRRLLFNDRCKPLPETAKTPLTILEHLAATVDYEECVKESLGRLLELFKDEDNIVLGDHSKRLIAYSMTNNMTDELVQIIGLDVLCSLVLCAKSGDVLFTDEIIQVIPKAMKTYPGNIELQQSGITLMMALGAEKKACDIIGELDGIRLIVNAMKRKPEKCPLMTACCNALWTLAVSKDNLLSASKEKAIVEITKALKTHTASPELVEAACAAIIPLSLDETIFPYVNEMDLVGALIEALNLHTRVAKVVKNGCMALAGLCEPNEECAYRILAGDNPEVESIGGIPVVMKAYEIHKDNAEVVEAIVNLVKELTEYDDIKAEMRYLKTSEKLLFDVVKRFKNNANVTKPCEEAMKKIAEVENKKQKEKTVSEKETE